LDIGVDGKMSNEYDNCFLTINEVMIGFAVAVGIILFGLAIKLTGL